MRVLVVEDEEMIAFNIKKHLTHEGYAVDTVGNGIDACDYLRMIDYDVVILDLMLPGMNGYQVIDFIKANQIPAKIIILSAKSTVLDRIKGLDLGADDYMIKPFSLEELSARIRVILRRHTAQSGNELAVDKLVLNQKTKKVFYDEQEVVLTSREFSILEYLMRNQGVVITRDQLLEHVWSYDYDGTSNIIDVYIRTLRKKLGPGRTLIETLRGTGYVIR